jgi:hypothetical protein
LAIGAEERLASGSREHYGFIDLAAHGSLGIDGKGKAPQWRLTELGDRAREQMPTREFHYWDGVLFERKAKTTDPSYSRRTRPNGQSPSGYTSMAHTSGTVGGSPTLAHTSGTVQAESVPHVGDGSVPYVWDGVSHTSGPGFQISDPPLDQATTQQESDQKRAALEKVYAEFRSFYDN